MRFALSCLVAAVFMTSALAQTPPQPAAAPAYVPLSINDGDRLWDLLGDVPTKYAMPIIDYLRAREARAQADAQAAAKAKADAAAKAKPGATDAAAKPGK
jgi:hypothetical protein